MKNFTSAKLIFMLMVAIGLTSRNTQGKNQIAAVDPVASMMAVDNEKIKPIAEDIKALLEKAINSL